MSEYTPMATAVPLMPEPLKPYYDGQNDNNKNTSTLPSPSVSSSSSSSHVIQHTPRPIGDNQVQSLVGQGFTRGLAKSLDEMRQVFALRFWIIDNSGSMQRADGHRIVSTRNKDTVKMIPCSRWEEIVECVEYHIRMAGLIEAPTIFRLLNNPGIHVGPQEFSIATESKSLNDSSGIEIAREVQEAVSIMRKARPSGCTPLTSHILEIHREISQMAPELNQLGKKVVIVIATDGLPTDERGHGGPQYQQEFVQALRMLEGLPVWVVVRLCTDEDNVVEFYDELDAQLELSLEVLDDFSGEALEVKKENPWLNYALPLHRLREMGYHDRVFDMLDERLLTKSEFRDFCHLLFGQDQFDGIPDPNIEWDRFVYEIEELARRESNQYDPVKKRVGPWLNISELNRSYGEAGSCVIL